MAVHIENLEIDSYRGIHNLKIENLGDINIFVGDNNTGKTSVLEAIQFFCEPNPYNLLQIARQREKYRAKMGNSFVDSIRYLFDVDSSKNEVYNLTMSGTVHGKKGMVRVSGTIDTQLMNVAELKNVHYVGENENLEEIEAFFGKIQRNFSFPTVDDWENETFEVNNYSRMRLNSEKKTRILRTRSVLTVDHVLENAFNMLIKESKIKDQAVKLLREQFDDTISDLRIIGDSNSLRYIPVIENIHGDYIPLSLYGDGMKKALTMLNAIVNTKNGVVLIDEFETALHTSAMTEVFSFVIESANQMGVQLFMTTHSLEAVDKMLESAGGKKTDIRVIRLKRKNGKTFSRVMTGQEAVQFRKDYNLELRV